MFTELGYIVALVENFFSVTAFIAVIFDLERNIFVFAAISLNSGIVRVGDIGIDRCDGKTDAAFIGLGRKFKGHMPYIIRVAPLWSKTIDLFCITWNQSFDSFRHNKAGLPVRRLCLKMRGSVSLPASWKHPAYNH